MEGPTLPISQELHAEKYRGPNESFREGMGRVASALTDNPQHYQAFRDIIMDMRFLPGGRVQSAMGSTRCVTPYNCFVSGTIEDSFVEGNGSIMQRAKEAAATMRQGGGIGYDFSTLRPRGDVIRKLQSHSSGPISFMDIYDAVCRCVASSGHRRGAQMGVMRVDHPDIEEFVRAKQPNDEMRRLWEVVERIEDPTEYQAAFAALQQTLRFQGFNVSVAITDEFMIAVKRGDQFPLRFGNTVHKYVDANALWNMIMRSTWDWAEPGVLFIDRINEMNNLRYCETIAATNPCGEQPLPPHGACLLGSFNMVKYLTSDRMFDWGQINEDVRQVVRAMDNVTDRARFPLYEQEKEAKNKRRMGLGVTGLANAIEAQGHPYGSRAFLITEDRILSEIKTLAYLASVELAAEKGPFPLFTQQYLDSKFLETMDPDVHSEIAKYGIRNSHLTSIAPTGTISLCADNVSSGIEPVFSYEYDRRMRTASGDRVETVTDYGVRVFGVRGKRAQDVTIDEHLAVLLTAAVHMDSAVSKTCNVSGDVDWEQFKGVYMRAWEGGAKGCTTFRINGKRMGILKARSEEDEGESCTLDPITGRRNCE